MPNINKIDTSNSRYAEMLKVSSPPRPRAWRTHLAICYSRIIQNFQLLSILWYFLTKVQNHCWSELYIGHNIKTNWNRSILCLNEGKISLHWIWLERAGPPVIMWLRGYEDSHYDQRPGGWTVWTLATESRSGEQSRGHTLTRRQRADNTLKHFYRCWI